MRVGRDVIAPVVAAAIFVWWLFAGGGGSDRASRGDTRAAASAPVDATSRAASLVREGASPRPPAVPPVIDSITVEKPVVCKGEENLVTVVAHDPSGDDADLRVVVGATLGDRVPLRLFDAGGEWPRVIVHGRDGTLTTAPVPAFEVAECEEELLVAIDYRLTPNTWAEYDLAVRLMQKASNRGEPVEFRWTFGDGTTEISRVPRVVHSYADRRQDTQVSSFLVGVEVEWDDGRVARGRASLQLLNPAYESLEKKGIVQLFRDLEPRFPVRDGDGIVRQEVRVRHARAVPVTITRVVMRRQGLDGNVGEGRTVDVAEVFARGTTIAPGSAIVAAVELDLVADPEIYSLDYVIEGHDADGNRALGSFSVMRPPDVPTREHHDPVTDPAFKAKIEKALAITGRPTVSMEDIVRLEREGRLD